MHENDIQEYYGEIEAIHMVDQYTPEYAARDIAKTATIEWLMGHGFKKDQADTIVWKSMRKKK